MKDWTITQENYENEHKRLDDLILEFNLRNLKQYEKIDNLQKEIDFLRASIKYTNENNLRPLHIQVYDLENYSIFVDENGKELPIDYSMFPQEEE